MNRKDDPRVKKEIEIIQLGGSIAMVIPAYYRDYLGLGEHDKIVVMDDTNKKGQRFVSFWKKEE